MSTNDAIVQLDAVARALGEVDVTDWSDATLRGQLDELSGALCAVDGQLSRLADAIRARGFRITEPLPATEALPAPGVTEPLPARVSEALAAATELQPAAEVAAPLPPAAATELAAPAIAEPLSVAA